MNCKDIVATADDKPVSSYEEAVLTLLQKIEANTRKV